MKNLTIKIELGNIKALDKQIDYVDKMLKMKTDKDFQQYIQDKCMKTLEEITNQRLVGGTTNDLEFDLYKKSNHIKESEDGFILYNDAKIPADKYNIIPFDTSGYPDGKFNVALAFEYGTGIVNTTNITKSSSHKKLGDKWYLPKSVMGESHILTSGYKGFEIYRYTAIEITKKLKSWVNDYYTKNGGK